MDIKARNDQILDLERQTWEALKRSGKDLLPYLTPDCCMLLPGGTIFDSKSKPNLEEILSRDDFKPWTEFEMLEVRILDLGVDAAAICYEVEAKRGEEVYTALVSSVWRRGEGDIWHLVLHQQSPV